MAPLDAEVKALLQLGQRQWWAIDLPPKESQPAVREALVRRRHHHPLRALLPALQAHYRDLAHIMGELGVCVAPCTILRLVVRYSVDFADAGLPYERAMGRSWRCDETYIKVGGQWMYLYRAVDERGKTVESHLSRTRDIAAAKAFFRKALKRRGQPRTITLDGFEATHSALRRMGMRNKFNVQWENPVRIRSCQYLSNVVEQDHRRIKSRVQPMLGFRSSTMLGE